jgi:hypothetical protein
MVDTAGSSAESRAIEDDFHLCVYAYGSKYHLIFCYKSYIHTYIAPLTKSTNDVRPQCSAQTQYTVSFKMKQPLETQCVSYTRCRV